MNWNQLLSTKRFGQEERIIPEKHIARTEFQRDYDRIIFSSPFRRLQNKTQVFPLPGSVFVHNRLTHSLEVACVGRTLGNMVSERILSEKQEDSILLHELGTIVSTSCLVHDIGNPPFGHSGEKAISTFFESGEGKKIKKECHLSEQQWKDLITFEGNANALRLLTHQFQGRRKGGYALTYSTLGSMIKYPYNSLSNTKNKFGFFYTEEESYKKIAEELGLTLLDSEKGIFARHPLLFLMEAADDISYLIMDLEDAHKLGIMSSERTKEILKKFVSKPEMLKKIEKTFLEVTDANEQISYLRAIVINQLATESVNIFMNNYEGIMSGEFQKHLTSELSETSAQNIKELQDISYKEIYSHKKVIEIELAGFNILGELTKEFVEAVLKHETLYHKKIIALIPKQYTIDGVSAYEKIRSVIDFISGMTDLYALEIFRNIKGIEMPSLR
ncbi:MAG: deoxyguanosinetriphosphate triphosphohydrolase [Bacteroidota bacterium]|nr:deoxyguanosinetriphosphate triphosphohydrolase [Bacteroidota bacterium]